MKMSSRMMEGILVYVFDVINEREHAHLSHRTHCTADSLPIILDDIFIPFPVFSRGSGANIYDGTSTDPAV